MNSQIDILRQTLEGISERSEVNYYFTDDYQPGDQDQVRKFAENLLEEFPEEDSDHVRAYRAVQYLTDFINRHEIDEPDHFDGYTLEQRLFDLRLEVEPAAKQDILQRLEADTSSTRRGFSETQIHDPVTKTTHQFADSKELRKMGSLDDRGEMVAQKILEAPL